MTEQTTSMTVDELEAALRLLSAEEQVGQADKRKLFFSLILYCSLAIALVACPLGTLLVWFDAALGWTLLIIALISVIIFGILILTGADIGFAKGINDLQNALGEGNLAKTAKSGWEERSRRFHLFLGCGCIPTALISLIGLGWLIYDLVLMNGIKPVSLVMIAVPILMLYVMIAVNQYREFQYYAQVTQMHTRFQSRLQQVRSEGLGETTIPSEEVSRLGEIETAHLDRKVKQTAPKIAEKLTEFYSVTIAPGPLDYLDSLAKEQQGARYEIRELVDSLGVNPYPPNAQVISGYDNRFIISSESHKITFTVDDTRRNIDIIEIGELDG